MLGTNAFASEGYNLLGVKNYDQYALGALSGWRELTITRITI